MSTAGAGGSTPTPAEQVAPVWTDAPTDSMAIGQGQPETISVSISDDNGDDVTVTLDALPGVAVTYADGELEVFAAYLVAGDVTITVALTDTTGLWTATDVVLTVAPLTWMGHESWSVAEGPEEREHATVLFDSASKQVFMFGGSGYHPQ